MFSDTFKYIMEGTNCDEIIVYDLHIYVYVFI